MPTMSVSVVLSVGSTTIITNITTTIITITQKTVRKNRFMHDQRLDMSATVKGPVRSLFSTRKFRRKRRWKVFGSLPVSLWFGLSHA